jgi:hypothetical protein
VKIAILNRSTVLTDAAVEAALPAFKHYASLVASAWGLKTPTVYFTATPTSTDWQIVILDDADQAGALGYHDFTVNGRPIAKVFAKTDKTFGYSWTITLAHELAEMQVDPWIAAAAQTSDTRFYALEVGDPVEDDSLGFAYTDSVGHTTMLSDFALPAWFQPGAKGPYSHAHHCTAPLQVLAGGYAQFFEDGSWNQVGPNGERMPMDADDQRLRTRW